MRPRSDDPAVGQQARSHHAVLARTDAGHRVGIGDRCAVGVGDVVLVEHRQCTHGVAARGATRARRRHEETLGHLDHAVPTALGRLTRGAQRQARPPGEVRGTGRTVPVDVAHEHLGRRVIGHGRLRNMLVGEDEQLLAPDRAVARDDRTLHEHGIDTQRPDDVHSPLPGRIDTELLDVIEQLRPGAAAVGELLAQSACHARQHLGVDAELTVPPGGLLALAGTGDRENPAQIGGGDDVQRAPHGPRPHELTPRERAIDRRKGRRSGGADAERPSPAQELLALHREHVRSGIRHRSSRSCEAMRSQPFGEQSAGRHDTMMPCASDITPRA